MLQEQTVQKIFLTNENQALKIIEGTTVPVIFIKESKTKQKICNLTHIPTTIEKNTYIKTIRVEARPGFYDLIKKIADKMPNREVVLETLPEWQKQPTKTLRNDKLFLGLLEVHKNIRCSEGYEQIIESKRQCLFLITPEMIKQQQENAQKKKTKQEIKRKYQDIAFFPSSEKRRMIKSKEEEQGDKFKKMIKLNEKIDNEFVNSLFR